MIDVPVEVKDALREGSYRKNYRVVVLATDTLEEFTIDNNNLVKESVSIDERMVSGDTLKFGLCEGSSLEFQYFEKENITGRQLQVFCDVSYEDAGTELTQNDSYTVSKAGNYEILVPANTPRFDIEYQPDGGLIETIRVYSSSTEQTVALNNCGVGDVVSFSSSSDISVTLRGEGGLAWCEIPMGYFTVKKCSRQASTGIIKVTAYNKLQSDYLDAKANELLLSSFVDQNQDVTLYDIKRLLLSDYQISEEETVEQKMGEWGLGMYLDDATATKFTYAWGQQSPINYYDLRHLMSSSTSEFKLAFDNAGFNWTLDPTKYYRIDSLYDLDALEQSLYDYIEQMIARANPTNSIATYMDNLVKRCYGSVPDTTTVRTWKYIFGIVLTKADDTQEWYTLIGKNNGLSGVVGGLSDLTKTLITGYKKLEFWTADAIYGYQSSTPTHKICDLHGDDFEYTIFSTSALISSQTETYTYPSFKFPDGSVIGAIGIIKSIKVYEVDGLTDAELVKVDIGTLPEFTLRDITSATYETVCQFGQLSRETDLFRGVELNHSRLLPADTLYPSNVLYPDGSQESAFRSQYSKLWADEGNIHKWRYLIITYKGLDEEQNEKDFTLQRTVNADGTDDYNMSDNWLFRNLVWTAEDVGTYADAMVAKMQDITWFPFEMWCAGLPYLETGDEIEIPLGEETYTSYILQRQLKGIQNLQDTYINGTLDIF